LGHALVGEEKGYGIVAGFEFAKGGEGGAAGVGAHDAIAVRIVAAEVTLDGAEDLGVIVNRE
jgi:hypothetical protein